METEFRLYIKSVSRLKRDPRLRNPDKLSFKNIAELQQDLTRSQYQLDTIKKKLQRRLNIAEEESNQMSQYRLTREKSRDSIDTTSVPEALLQRIQTVLDNLQSMEQSVQKPLERVFTLSNRIADENIILNTYLKETNTAMEQAQARLLKNDSPPLWKAIGEKADSSLIVQIGVSQINRLQVLIEYFSENKIRFILHTIVFMALLILATQLRKRSKKWILEKEDESLQASLHVISRPISSVLLISLLIIRSIYPQIPEEVARFFSTLLIIPILRLLPSLLPQQLRIPLYIFAGIYILERIHAQTFEQFFIQRIFLLLLSLAILIWLAGLSKLKLTELQSK